MLLSILYLRCRATESVASDLKPEAFNSLFEMHSIGDAGGSCVWFLSFNSLIEMLRILESGFCGFLSFCVGVCRFLAGAC